MTAGQPLRVITTVPIGAWPPLLSSVPSHRDFAPRFYAFTSQVGKLTRGQPKWHTQGHRGRKQNVNSETQPIAKLVAQQQGGTQNNRLKKEAFTCW